MHFLFFERLPTSSRLVVALFTALPAEALKIETRVRGAHNGSVVAPLTTVPTGKKLSERHLSGEGGLVRALEDPGRKERVRNASAQNVATA